MHCVKCGGMLYLDALSCFHCGAAIDHKANILSTNWDAHDKSHKVNIRLFPQKGPVSSLIGFATWASLIIPALSMPYIFKLSFEKYREWDSLLLDFILSLIVFFVFYFTKKALYNPTHNR